MCLNNTYCGQKGNRVHKRLGLVWIRGSFLHFSRNSPLSLHERPIIIFFFGFQPNNLR